MSAPLLEPQDERAQAQRQTRHTAPSTFDWSNLPCDLLKHASTYLPCATTASSFCRCIQQLCLLSVVCVEWRNMVYYESSSGRGDYWTTSEIVAVVQQREYDAYQYFCVAGKVCPAAVVQGALSSLRLVRSLQVGCGYRPPALSGASLVSPLQRYTRLTSLDLHLTSQWQAAGEMVLKARRAFNTALCALADRQHCQLRSLALQCPGSIMPNAEALRRVCSLVLQLKLPLPELMLMARGSVNPPSHDTVWSTHSVQSFVFLPGGFVPHPRPSKEVIVGDIDASLPSCTQLHDECFQPNESVSNRVVQQRLSQRLVMFRCNTACRTRLWWRFSSTCAALVSLCVIDDSLHSEGIANLLAAPADCTSLTELTIVVCRGQPIFSSYVHLTPLPRLRYLHLAMPAEERYVTPSALLDPLLTPNITHLALTLSVLTTDVSSPLPAIDAGRLPRLSRFYFRDWQHGGQTEQAAWHTANDSFKARLGSAWCDSEDDVTRWRYDRVWKRTEGLPDDADDWPKPR